MSAPSATRRLQSAVEEDLLAKKMAFVAGPRQCGKTTLARQVLARHGGEYFSWDVPAHRKALREQAFPAAARLWVFDELHKMRGWRNWLKGVYDLHGSKVSILVTGSGRLDVYSRGGDSLQGRYFLHRLHPFTFSELSEVRLGERPDDFLPLPIEPPAGAGQHLDDLMRFGGFPEPLFSRSERRAARWRLGYGARLVREDIRDLENLRDLDKVELLFDRLPDTVGSVLSINALREDLEVSFATAKNWLAVLERLYAVFRLAPLGAPRIKAVKKEQKLYFWDWGRVENEAARFENLLVSHLLTLAHWLEDVHGEKAEVRYFRDVVGHEVDAVVLRKGKPWLAVEAKLDDRPLDGGLKYLLERYKIPWAFQVSLRGTADRWLPPVGGCRVRLVPATRFLANLP
jgi:predicted AAA+ superfamily ATPase